MEKKPLTEMTLQELWQLFPIVLKEHNPQYFAWYAAEERALLSVVGAQNIVRIQHIGSTAVAGLLAKPIVDILMEIANDCDTECLKAALLAADWLLMNEQAQPYPQISFNKGYTPEGFAEQVFHLHVRYAGDWDEPHFRDYLIANPNAGAQYAALKTELKAQYEHDRDAYTDAKGEFVRGGVRP